MTIPVGTATVLWNTATSVADPDPNPDPPDPYVFGPPGSGSISQRYGAGSGSFYHHAKIVRKTLIPPTIFILWLKGPPSTPTLIGWVPRGPHSHWMWGWDRSVPVWDWLLQSLSNAPANRMIKIIKLNTRGSVKIWGATTDLWTPSTISFLNQKLAVNMAQSSVADPEIICFSNGYRKKFEQLTRMFTYFLLQIFLLSSQNPRGSI